MFCIKCGKEILDEAIMCPHCGNMVPGKSNQKNDEYENFDLVLKAVGIEKIINSYSEFLNDREQRCFDFMFGENSLVLKIRDCKCKLILNTKRADYNSLNADFKTFTYRGVQYNVLSLQSTEFSVSILAMCSKPEKKKYGLTKLTILTAKALSNNEYGFSDDSIIRRIDEEIKRRKQ
ncbi:MAG: zinc ribbon domain-containing protein [Clostridia bacterium]|nr:zinc ribbon domain-containing protein [Clostridia bacterium]